MEMYLLAFRSNAGLSPKHFLEELEAEIKEHWTKNESEGEGGLP